MALLSIVLSGQLGPLLSHITIDVIPSNVEAELLTFGELSLLIFLRFLRGKHNFNLNYGLIAVIAIAITSFNQ